MNKLATLTLLCLLPCAAQADSWKLLPPAEAARLTQEAPPPHNCQPMPDIQGYQAWECFPDGERGYPDQLGITTPISVETVGDLLPPIVREQWERREKKRGRS